MPSNRRSRRDRKRARRALGRPAPPAVTPKPFHNLGAHVRSGIAAEWWNEGLRGLPFALPLLGAVVGLLTFLGLGRRRATGDTKT